MQNASMLFLFTDDVGYGDLGSYGATDIAGAIMTVSIGRGLGFHMPLQSVYLLLRFHTMGCYPDRIHNALGTRWTASLMRKP